MDRVVALSLDRRPGASSHAGVRLRVPRVARQLVFYTHGAARTFRTRTTLANLVAGVLPRFSFGSLRARLYRLAGFQSINSSVYFMGSPRLIAASGDIARRLIVGERTVIGYDVTLNLDAEIHIGKDVTLGPRVLVYTGTHLLGPGSNRRDHDLLAKPVVIEDGCWIGLAAIILPGVRLGHGSVVAAGAVVSQSVPPNSYVEGNPARVVRELPWGDR